MKPGSPAMIRRSPLPWLGTSSVLSLRRDALRRTWRLTFVARFEHWPASPQPTFSPVIYRSRFRRVLAENHSPISVARHDESSGTGILQARGARPAERTTVPAANRSDRGGTGKAFAAVRPDIPRPPRGGRGTAAPEPRGDPFGGQICGGFRAVLRGYPRAGSRAGFRPLLAGLRPGSGRR